MEVPGASGERLLQPKLHNRREADNLPFIASSTQAYKVVQNYWAFILDIMYITKAL